MRKTILWLVGTLLATSCLAQTNGATGLQTSTVTLSSAQIKNLSASPTQLVAAPGAGSTIIVYSVVSTLSFSTIAFTDAGAVGLALRYDAGPSTAGTNLSAMYNVITGTSSQTGVDVPNAVVNPNPSPTANVQNKGLFLVNVGSNDFAAGDGTLTVTVNYQVVNQ